MFKHKEKKVQPKSKKNSEKLSLNAGVKLYINKINLGLH